MKKYILALLLACGALLAPAQGIPHYDNDTVYNQITPDRAVEQYIHFVHAAGAQSTRYIWKVTESVFPSQWFVTLCDDYSCHTLPHPGDSTQLMMRGDTNFLKLTVVPYSVAGSLKVVVHTWDMADSVGHNHDFVFFVDANTSTAVASAALQDQVRISPNPAHDHISISARQGVLEKGTVALYDLRGQLVLQRSVAATHNLNIELGDLKAGIYLLRYNTRIGQVTEKVVVTH